MENGCIEQIKKTGFLPSFGKDIITQNTRRGPVNKEIEKALKDYHWMMNTVKMMRDSMQGAGTGLVAQYGDEAGMPKAQGVTGDVVLSEVIRRGKRWDQIAEYERKIEVIQSNIHIITDEREVEILHWLLEGKGHSWISRHMGLSHTHIKRLSESIVKQMASNVQHVQNVQHCI